MNMDEDINDPRAEIAQTKRLLEYDDKQAHGGVKKYDALLKEMTFASEIIDAACKDYRQAVSEARQVFRAVIENASRELDEHVAEAIKQVRRRYPK